MYSSPAPMLNFATALVLFLRCFAYKSSEHVFAFSEDSSLSSSRNSIGSVSELEDKMDEIIFQTLTLIAPQLIDQVTTVTMAMECNNAVIKVFRGAIEMQDWAFKMLDAFGKPSAGLLEGSAAALGDYDECLDVEFPTKQKNDSKGKNSGDAIRGQYCMLEISIPEALRKAAMDYQAGNRSSSYLANTNTFFRNFVKIAPRADIASFRLGICLPSACSKDDVRRMIATVAGEFEKSVTVLRCETKEDNKLEVEQIIILAILAVTAFLVFSGTLIDTVLRTMASVPVDDVFFKKQNMYIQFLAAFSLGNNFRKLVKLETDDGQISCIRGLKFLTMCLIIFVTTYIMPIDLHFLRYKSVFNIHKFMDQWWFSLIANSLAGVDTLFFLAGLQITYKIWKKATTRGNNRVSINFIRFLVVWYSRLTASQVLIIALFLLFPLIGSGPLWGDVVIPEIKHCKTTWWMNVLSINTWWPANETCLYHTWLLTSLMHILLVTPFILWILSRWNVFGILLILILILGSCISVTVVTIVNELPPSPSIYFLSFLNLRWIWDKLFIQAYPHLAPFCIGILMGYLLALRPKVEPRKVTVIIGWSAVVASMLSIVFGLFHYRHGETMEPKLEAFYAGAHRLVWAMALAWIVFACAYGCGGAANEFLSWKVFIPLNRLSNMMYLLHPLVIFFHGGQVREMLHMGHLDQVVYSSAYILLTCSLSAFCYVIFVVPYRFVESMVWKPIGDRDTGPRNHTVSKVIAIKERITNDLNISMRDAPERPIIDNNADGVDNTAFSA